jgi:predicted Zn finger-like uncharacterized protein
MDVRCERCDTEYEFDDALVSGRGTTVKCTNCGHKFKIRRKDGDFSEDFWNVQTADGRTLVFTSLRELQRAIQTSLVERNDRLSRGGLKHKSIGQIPELVPFFEQRDLRKSAPPPPVTDATTAAAKSRSSRPPPPPGMHAPALGPPRKRQSTRPDYPPDPVASPNERAPAPLPSMKRTLAGTGESSPLPSASEPRSASPSRDRPGARSSEVPPTEREAEPDTERFGRAGREPITASGLGPKSASSPSSREPTSAPSAPGPASASAASARAALTRTQPMQPVPDSYPSSGRMVAAPPSGGSSVELPKRAAGAPAFEASSPLPPLTAPTARAVHVDDEYAARGRGRPSENPPSSMGRRRPVGGYIVAAVVLAGAGLVGALWARDHLGALLGGRPPPVVASDPRVGGLLAAGEKALAEGNLDVAKESFDKASALAEKDSRVLLDLARLATVRADMSWLKSRLLASDATDDVRLTRESLAELSAAAKKAADDASAIAPDDPAALRTKLDALRIGGDREGARALAGRVGGAGSTDNAYVLAALDLAEGEPPWLTVIERLRSAAKDESGPGRARAALVYALARSGDVVGAKAEVERLAGLSRQHPLLPLLRAFAEHAKPLAKLDLPTLADAGAKGGAGLDGGAKGDKGKLPSDARQLIVQGEAARGKGDLERAQTLFSAALDRNPNDTEALSGIAAIAHARRDLNGARASYKRVLSLNSGYVPALVGLGDVDWESGDRGAAMKTYKEIVDRYPEGSYPPRIKARLESGSGAAPAPVPQPSSPASATVAPTPAPSDTGGGG